MPIDRRQFIAISAAACSALLASQGLTGCGASGDQRESEESRNFVHGVASGDPAHDSVILWTRFSPSEEMKGETVGIGYKVALDPGFDRIVDAGTVWIDESTDYTVHAEAVNLEAGTVYYYRFETTDGCSATGRTKTLPLETDKVRLAFFSCANFTYGYFNAYDHAAKLDEVDAVIHLGDYIYEYGMFEADGTSAYATERAEAIGRVLPEDNETELLTLSDYRKRYALYRSDPMLRALHQSFPFICVWDDHEIANDAWVDGAANHSEGAEGTYAERKQYAMQAYFEWLPIRTRDISEEVPRIYRSFTFGNLVSLHMLDTRHEGRSRQLSMTAESLEDPERFRAELSDLQRSLMSENQWAWLADALHTSTGLWTVIGQQVIVGKLELPVELAAILMQLLASGLSASQKEVLTAEAEQVSNELASIKLRQFAHDPTLTADEIARLETKVPYNLDAWDGYPEERNRLYSLLRGRKNSFIFSGDSHNAWCNDLEDGNGTAIATEVGVTSVSSPGIEAYLDLTDPAQLGQVEAGIKIFNPELMYDNLSDRGYVLAEFTPDTATVHWVFVDTITSQAYEINQFRSKTLIFPVLNE